MLFKGTITRILTQKDDDWGRYKTEDISGASKLLVGVIPFAAPGMYVEVTGYDEVTKYGPQFKVQEVIKTKPGELSGIISFLSFYIKGVGDIKAAKIANTFGDKALKQFETIKGQAALVENKFFTKKNISFAVTEYEQNKKYAPLLIFFKGALTQQQAEKIFTQYKSSEAAIKAISRNPYRLIDDMDGFGFKKTDALALSIGIKPTSRYRLGAAMTFILDTAAQQDGDCYLDYETLKSRTVLLLGEVPKLPEISKAVAENSINDWSPEKKEYLVKTYNVSQETLDTLDETIMTRKYLLETFQDVYDTEIEEGRLINDNGRIFSKKMYSMEDYVARTFAGMAESKPTFSISAKKIDEAISAVEKEKSAEIPGFAIEEEQKQAIRNGLTHRISIMTGGPGTGKTTTIETIARAFLSIRGKHEEDIIMLAPTGRAAQRIKEQTGYDAKTIHRGIFEYPHGQRELAEAPSGKLIICDEFSMVEIGLAASLAKYARYSNLIMVGDVNQIASVGPGKVLKDLITSGVIPTTFLALGHRNVGSIAINAQKINNGEHIDRYIYDDQFHRKEITQENAITTVVNDYVENVNRYGIKEVMLATAMKKRGLCCVDTLNAQLQKIFTGKNDFIQFNKSRKFALGDRVMQTVNNYTFRRTMDGTAATMFTGVFNGEKGTVVKLFHENETPDGIPRMVVQFDDGSLGGYSKDNIMNLVLAYATTVHKCQGSEAKCMMMVYMQADFILLRRSLFYTGETRAKEEFYFYDEMSPYGRSAFNMAADKLEDKERNTGLADRLKEYHDKNSDNEYREAV